MKDKKNIEKKEKIAGILLITLSIMILLSLFYYNPGETIPSRANDVLHKMGVAGFYISYFLIRKTLGYFSYVFPILMLMCGANLIRRGTIKHLGRWVLYSLLFAWFLAIASALIGLPQLTPEQDLITVCSREPWGMIGGISKLFLTNFLGSIGGIIFFVMAFILGILSLIDVSFKGLSPRLSNWLGRLKLNIGTSGKKVLSKTRKTIPSAAPGEPVAGSIGDRGAPAITGDRDRMEAPGTDEKLDYAINDTTYLQQSRQPRGGPEPSYIDTDGSERPSRFAPMEAHPYVMPDSSILDSVPIEKDEVSWDEFMMNAKTLEQKLADFGIQGKVVEINPGPIITRYEIEPAPGVKVNRFTSLADDLALVMRAKRIRVVAPIPGKAAIGIEIPNHKPSIVYLKDIIDSPQFKMSKYKLPMAFGKTISGDVYVTDLVNMPHLLIAGATGSGKSVCLHTIIASLLFKSSPDYVQFVMIDPKRLELAPYAALKRHHLITREDIKETVITSPSNAVLMLKSLEREMERRYEFLARAGVRNIEDYNIWLERAEIDEKRIVDEPERLPYIILIIDELADLMLTAAREVEEPIARLTQMSRAVGIHLIVATQRPSVDVITGVIKANFPARMAFQVATKTDSRTILDINGAEKLLGKGDMLFIPPGTPEPIRVHNAFISLEEVKRLVEYVKHQPLPTAKTTLLTEEEIALENGEEMFGKDERDPLFNEALKLVVRHQQGSSSLLQRRLKIGYTRAARIIDQLEDAGFVGPYDGSKAREVLVDEDYLREIGVIK